MAWPNIHVSKIKIYAFWNLEFLQGCISQFERVRKLKSSFHILPSSGQRKISKFQLHRFGRSRQPDLPWMSQLPNLSASCVAVFSTDLPFIPEAPQLHGHNSVFSSENSHQPRSPPPMWTSALFLSLMPLQCISQLASLRRQQRLALLPSGGNLVKCTLHFPWNPSLLESEFFKLVFNWASTSFTTKL